VSLYIVIAFSILIAFIVGFYYAIEWMKEQMENEYHMKLDVDTENLES